MIGITPRALTVIRRVTAHPALAETSGLRIAPDAGPDRPLQVHAASAPEPDDHVLEYEGGRMFLAPGVPEHLAEGDLDARTDAAGRVRFVLRTAA